MACKNICRLCRRLIISSSVTYSTTTGLTTINIPSGTYVNCEKYCLVVANNIPDAATINSPVVITVGTGTTTYSLYTKDGVQVTASQLRTRTRYATRVRTTATGGAFYLLGDPCCSSVTNQQAITG